MFLRFLKEHNPGLIDYGMFLLERRLIGPDTYVLDIDGISANAARLRDISEKEGLSLYFMAKQLGRNPEAARRVLEAGKGKSGGFKGMVAVDFREACLLHSEKIPVKHLGHLCQIPAGAWDTALDMKPDVITLYSIEKAQELSETAGRRGIVQDVLLRVCDEGDVFYTGQEGGFPFKTLAETLDKISKLPNIRTAGVTSFPCFLYNDDQKKSLPTPNTQTIMRAAAMLKERGLSVLQLNMPSCNSPATIPIAAELGATHLEPGHSLTGTNPDNLYEASPLIPSLLYMSEVSHNCEGRSSVFGGGYYRRGKLRYALVRTSKGYEETGVLAPDSEAIDYHLQLSGLYPPGSPVCMAFRTQIFVTRSRLALVEGLARSKPSLLGIWDSQGRSVSGGSF